MEEGATPACLERPIWLVGHSYPGSWVQHLRAPLDPRHPVRHNIWTSVLDVIQEVAYMRGGGRRLDMGKVFVCNAAAKQQPGQKPDWDYTTGALPGRLELFRDLLATYRPPLVLTFGADVFEFVRRALPDSEGLKMLPVNARVRDTKALGQEFRRALQEFRADRINVLPLLHRSVSGGYWLSAHRDFTGDVDANYFEHVGEALGSLIVRHGATWDVWLRLAGGRPPGPGQDP